MNVSEIRNINVYGIQKQNTMQKVVQQYFVQNSNTQDVFVKTTPTPQSVAFTGNINKVNKLFEVEFPKSFFQDLISSEKIPDAYTGVTLIPRSQVPYFKQMGVFSCKSSVAINNLKFFKDSLFPIEKEAFQLLEGLSKKHPDMNLQELLNLKYPQAEQILITQQAAILNKIHFVVRQLPKKEYNRAKGVLNRSFDKIFAPNPIPEKRFSRKVFIKELEGLDIKPKVREKIIKIAENLPQSTNSINAFIVKYSQPYKLRYNEKTGKTVRITRDSAEIGEKLLEPSIGTVDHIHPQAAYRAEQLARENGKNPVTDLSTFKVTILTSKRINELKGDIPLDDFIQKSKYNIPENIQNHFDALIKTVDKWERSGEIERAAKLSDYIIVLRDEMLLRSKIVRPDLKGFEDRMPKIKAELNNYLATAASKKNSQSRSTNAANSHKEQYFDKSGHQMENRKVHKFSSRFHK